MEHTCPLPGLARSPPGGPGGAQLARQGVVSAIRVLPPPRGLSPRLNRGPTERLPRLPLQVESAAARSRHNQGTSWRWGGGHGAHIPGREAHLPLEPSRASGGQGSLARSHLQGGCQAHARPRGWGQRELWVWASLPKSWQRCQPSWCAQGHRFTMWPGTALAELSEPRPGSPQPRPRMLPGRVGEMSDRRAWPWMCQDSLLQSSGLLGPAATGQTPWWCGRSVGPRRQTEPVEQQAAPSSAEGSMPGVSQAPRGGAFHWARPPVLWAAGGQPGSGPPWSPR